MVKALVTVGNSLILRMLTPHSSVMLHWQREVRRPGNLKVVLAAVGNFAFSGLSEAASHIEHTISWNDADRQFDEYGEMTMNIVTTMLTGKIPNVMTSWTNQHTRCVFRQMTQNFLNSLVVIWQRLMHPHIKSMYQQSHFSRKHVSFCLVSRVPWFFSCRWHWCFWRLGPTIHSSYFWQSFVARARRVRENE